MIKAAFNRRGMMDEMLAKGEKLPFFFKMRMVNKGPYVAAKVTRACQCTVNGEEGHEWLESCDRYPEIISEINGDQHDLDRLLNGGKLTLIDKKEYKLLLGKADWDQKYDPDAPLASPTKPIDVSKMKPPF